jgi:hypothetical protein
MVLSALPFMVFCASYCRVPLFFAAVKIFFLNRLPYFGAHLKIYGLLWCVSNPVPLVAKRFVMGH